MFRYRLVLLIIGMSVGYLFAAAGDEHTFELKWQKDGFYNSLAASLDRSEPFAKEPDFGTREILRGQLNFGSSEKTEKMGFAWDKSEGKLYVDLNRDGNLTNDPNGILESERNQKDNYQTFPAFPFSFSTEMGVYRYRLRSSMYSYSGGYKRAEFYLDSGYTGKTELYGRQWTIDVDDKLAGIIQQGSRLSVLSADDDNSASNSMSSLPLPKNIFMDGRCYEIGFKFKKSEQPSPSLWCTLREKTVPMGKLRIESKWVHTLVFGDDEILILPDPVEGMTIVPAGNFTVKQCTLNHDKGKPAIAPTRLNEIIVAVPATGESVLRIGGPLNHQVKIQRTGRTLKLDYKLVGMGGETYDARAIGGYDNSKKPSVAVYKGDLQMAAGNFEFG
jgi:hypothetical protein